MTTLHLTLKREFYDAIAHGKKTEEYREYKAYWITRLGYKHFDRIVFSNGYGRNAPRMLVECLDIRVQDNLTTPLGTGTFFVIKLGRILQITSGIRRVL